MIFPYYGDFRGSHTLPDLYWNVVSHEQRVKALCMEYQKLVEFTNALVDTVNDMSKAIDEMHESLPGLVIDAIKNDPELKAEVMQLIENWFDETMTGTTYGEIKDNGFIYKEGE